MVSGYFFFLVNFYQSLCWFWLFNRLTLNDFLFNVFQKMFYPFLGYCLAFSQLAWAPFSFCCVWLFFLLLFLLLLYCVWLTANKNKIYCFLIFQTIKMNPALFSINCQWIVLHLQCNVSPTNYTINLLSFWKKTKTIMKVEVFHLSSEWSKIRPFPLIL